MYKEKQKQIKQFITNNVYSISILLFKKWSYQHKLTLIVDERKEEQFSRILHLYLYIFLGILMNWLTFLHFII